MPVAQGLRVCTLPDDPQATIVLGTEVDGVTLDRLDADTVARMAGRCDLVHLHLGLPRAPVVVDPAGVARALAFSGLPLVVTVHDLTAPTAATVEALRPAITRLLVPHGRLAPEVHADRSGRVLPVRPSPLAPLSSSAAGADGQRAPGTRPVGLYDGDDPLLVEVAAACRATRPEQPVETRSGRVAHPQDLATWVSRLDVLVLAPDTTARATWVELCRTLDVAVVVATGALDVDGRATTTYVETAGPDVVARAVRHASGQLAVARRTTGQQARLVDRVPSDHTDLYRRLAAVR